MNVLEWARAQWDRVLAVVLFAAGGLAILAGWAGVRQEALTAAQIPYVISGGLGGISLIGVGAVFWLSADLRDEWRKLDDLDAHRAPPPAEADGELEASDGLPTADGAQPMSARNGARTPVDAGSR